MISRYSYGDYVTLKDLEEDLEIYNNLTGEVQYHTGNGEYEILVLDTVTITVYEDNLDPAYTR